MIPTVTGDGLSEALRSVTRQSRPVDEMIVVQDGGYDVNTERVARSLGAKYLCSQRRVGANGARMMAIDDTTCDVIAFLDCDDTWTWLHVEALLALIVFPNPCIAFGRARVFRRPKSPGKIVPGRLYRPNEAVGDYLFRRRRLRSETAVMQTSCLMTTRETLRKFPLVTDVSRHQDWAWVLDVASDPTAKVACAPEVVTNYNAFTPGSISKASVWRESAAWLDQRADMFSATAYADFLLCVVGSAGAKARSPRSIEYVLRRVTLRAASWRSWLVFSGSWVLSIAKSLADFARHGAK